MQAQKNKGISIRLKLIGIIIPIVLVIIISFFALARNMVLKISQEEMQVRSKVYAAEISSWTGQIFAELQIYLDTIEGSTFSNDAEILKYMETTVEKNESYPVGLYMGDDKGVYLDGSGWVPGEDWVLVEREWYVEGKDNEEFAFGEPYYDSMTGQVCVSASVLVDYEKAVRVLATDVYLDYVSCLVSEISNQGEVDAFLVTKDSQTIIAHIDSSMMAVTLDAEGIDSLYADVGEELAADKSGLIQISDNGNKYYVCLNPVEHTDWYLITYVTEEKVLADLHQMEIIMGLIALVSAVVLMIAILRMMNRVVKPVKKMTDVIDRIAEGDFSQNLQSKGNDEIARMSNNMQMFITQMRGTISEIRRTAEWLERQSAENEEVSDSLKQSARKQAQEMGMLEQMAERLSEAAGKASVQMDNLASLVQETHTEGEVADSLMKESVVMSQNGKDDMEHINKGMTDINLSITTLSEQIDKVGKIVSQIGEMVTIIIDIAEETNLLSLNASIEAARAGEAGRGFSVVAEQIGKLAANSSAAADSISKLTNEIQSTVDSAVEHMDGSIRKVQANVAFVSEASTTFEELYEKVGETSRRVEQMLELISRVDVVSRQMEEISKTQVQATEQIVQSAEELNYQTQNVTADSNTVAESAKELKKQSVELIDRMKKFNV